MGGVVEHLQHLYDNPNITFKEIKDILTAASDGDLKQVSEKFDGLNLVFSWDSSANSLKAARAGGDIKRGGLTAADLSQKFRGRGSLDDAFNSAFNVLNKALSTLDEKVKIEVFGPAANKWYSIEIIYPQNPNVIVYDSNAVVFHHWPIFASTEDGNFNITENDQGFRTLMKHLKEMQEISSKTGWQLRAPAPVKLERISNPMILSAAIDKIDAFVSSAGLSHHSTIGDYFRVMMRHEVKKLKLSPHVSTMVINRSLKEPAAPSLIDIKKNSNKSDHDLISNFVKNSPKLIKNIIRPFELVINSFAIELLRNAESSLINDATSEVRRIRNEALRVISKIKSSGDSNMMNVLNSQLEKLGTVDNITTPLEGIVFIHNGNTYKFTGTFASLNQILGLVRY